MAISNGQGDEKPIGYKQIIRGANVLVPFERVKPDNMGLGIF